MVTLYLYSWFCEKLNISWPFPSFWHDQWTLKKLKFTNPKLIFYTIKQKQRNFQPHIQCKLWPIETTRERFGNPKISQLPHTQHAHTPNTNTWKKRENYSIIQVLWKSLSTCSTGLWCLGLTNLIKSCKKSFFFIYKHTSIF